MRRDQLHLRRPVQPILPPLTPYLPDEDFMVLVGGIDPIGIELEVVFAASIKQDSSRNKRLV